MNLKFPKQLWLPAILCVFAWNNLLRGTDVESPSEVAKVIENHCVECHQGPDAEAQLRLDELGWDPAEERSRSQWIKIFDRVRTGEMPPDSPLDAKNRQSLLDNISTAMSHPIMVTQRREGRTILRRLNRREFENSLHDLFQIDVPLQHLLPPDSRSQGFDTVSDGLRISALQIEKYFEAIDTALDSVFVLTTEPGKIDEKYSLKNERDIRKNLDTPENEPDATSGAKHKHLFYERDDAIVYISHGYSPDTLRQFTPTADGLYRVRISAYAVDSPGVPVYVRVFKGDYKTHQLVGHFEVTPDQPRVVELTLPISTREHLQINGYNIGIDENGKNLWNVDTIKNWKVPGLAVQWVEVQGPLIDQWPPSGLRRLVGDQCIVKLDKPAGWSERGRIDYAIVSDDAKSTVRKVVESFATRAFRRPLEKNEVDPFVKIAIDQLDAGSDLQQAIRVAIRSVLVSPQFLFLRERPGVIDDYALAARLSYFFWSSMPDEELLQLASENRLSDPIVLKSQVNRMLDSRRSAEFVNSFVGQWLDLNQIDATTPDAKLYPEYDEMMRVSLVAESEAFFTELLKEDLSVSNVIDSEFLMLDQRLSDLYAIPFDPDASASGVFGEQFRRVSIPQDSPRGGFLTQAAILKVTANGTVTSPVVRGSWILRHILGTPPSPPPPVEAIEPDTRGATTIREQLAKHRDTETCNRCHQKIDPPGFALESFDVIGGYRQRYRSVGEGDRPTEKLKGRDIWEYKWGLEVDSSGQSPDGKPFRDIQEYKQILMADQTQVLRNLTNQMVTYGTGASISFADRTEIERIVKEVTDHGSGLRTLIHEVVQSDLFRHK
jgi:hypothetical protein